MSQLHKKNSINNPANFRGISLLSVFSKIMVIKILLGIFNKLAVKTVFYNRLCVLLAVSDI